MYPCMKWVGGNAIKLGSLTVVLLMGKHEENEFFKNSLCIRICKDNGTQKALLHAFKGNHILFLKWHLEWLPFAYLAVQSPSVRTLVKSTKLVPAKENIFWKQSSQL